jgi:hypothetical protein
MKKMLLLSVLLISIPSFGFTVEEGKKILGPFKKELMGTLMSEMKTGGPIAALKSCHLKAMPITDKYAKKVIAMGRTSHKIRNPKNTPQKWVNPYLEEFKNGVKKEAIVVKLENGHSGYLEPIYILPKCLVCHGDNVDPNLKKEIDILYPQDQARGFKVGEFRGLFWMEVK